MSMSAPTEDAVNSLVVKVVNEIRGSTLHMQLQKAAQVLVQIFWFDLKECDVIK